MLEWYARSARALPWRETSDPYRIWVSEIMLQQTRVAAVLPYYKRFLEYFPDVASLAEASEDVLLGVWSGLGYYSRVRNMRKAAREMVAMGGFPREYEGIRKLPGVGDYTAAAVASIAFGLPHAVLDGNVLRVLSRLTAEAGDIRSSGTKNRLREAAGKLLDKKQPGTFNQALMELGATICVPREPKCPSCPILRFCEARRQGRQHELPVKSEGTRKTRILKTLLFIERKGRVLLWKRTGGSRMRGFWELPEAEQLPRAVLAGKIGEFRHSITSHNYRFTLIAAKLRYAPRGFCWIPRTRSNELPLSTVSKKALTCWQM